MSQDLKSAKKLYDANRYLLLRHQITARVKGYYRKNRAAIIKKVKTWNLERPERNKAYSAKWRFNNKDFKRIVCRKWELKNPDKVRAKSHRRRARKSKNSTIEQIHGADLKISKMLSVKYTDCAYCGKRFLTHQMHVDHILAIARGGAHSPDNICMACDKCNESKNARLLGSEWIPPQLSFNLKTTTKL